MILRLIGRGLLAGAAAGLLMYVFVITVLEPVIDQAIAYEGVRDDATRLLEHDTSSVEPDMFTRMFQGHVGTLFTSLLFCLAMGAIVAVAFTIAVGRTGSLRQRTVAMLVPLFGFIALYAVPFAKYPANPPAIGHEETIAARSGDYLILVACSAIFLFLAVYFGQKLRPRLSAWNVTIVMGVAYTLVMALVMIVLPGFHETPGPILDAHGTMLAEGFPADVLAKFRVYSILNQIIVWGTIAIVFAPLASKLVEGRKELV